jgi:hypothetical protein
MSAREPGAPPALDRSARLFGGFVPLRNALVKELSNYLGVPVIMSDQTGPEPPPPFIVYTVLTANVPIDNRGARMWRGESDGTISDIRVDAVRATLSITAISNNRWDEQAEPPRSVSGDDEAFALSERARNWLDFIGRDTLDEIGIVVEGTMNARNRSGVVIDESERRYGFDITIRYNSAVGRTVPAIENITIHSIRKRGEGSEHNAPGRGRNRKPGRDAQAVGGAGHTAGEHRRARADANILQP